MSGDFSERVSPWTFRYPDPIQWIPPGPTPSFTVMIPAYQAAAFIGTALESVRRQTLAPLEVLVVDDGSTDDLDSALTDHLHLIRLIRIPHRGLPAARNVALRAARGDFIAFLDADDVFEPEFLEAVAELSATRPDLDILTTDAQFLVSGVPAGTFYGHNPWPGGDQTDEIVRRCFITTKSAVRSSRLVEIGGFDEDLLYSEDWDCWIRLVLTGSRIGLVNAVLSQYRMHDGQLSARRAASLAERLRVLEKARQHPALSVRQRVDMDATKLPALRRRVAVVVALETRPGPLQRFAWGRIAFRRGVSARTRLLGVFGALAPGAAAHRDSVGGSTRSVLSTARDVGPQ